MKKIFFIVTSILVGQYSFGQIQRFSDVGVAFNQQELSGTARYKGLSGAMGALGGDISAIANNPAGLGVLNYNDFTISAGSNTKSTDASYYGSNSNQTEFDFNLRQVGLAFVFERDGDWNKTVFAINYQRTNNFDNFYRITGNSGFATFQTHPEPVFNDSFVNGVSQTLSNETSGFSSVFNLGLASQYKDKFYLGASVNVHNLSYSQLIQIAETNVDGNDNIVDPEDLVLEADFSQEDNHNADGLSINAGFIYKVTEQFRLGASYQSPIWYYDIVNENNVFDGRENRNFGRAPGNGRDGDLNPNAENNSPTEIAGSFQLAPLFTDTNGVFVNNDLSLFEYAVRTANKFGLSTAIVLNNFGLISLDYSYHNVNGINLSKDDFSVENDYFNNVLNNTHNIRGGAELKLDNFTLRGGLSFEQSPFKDADKLDITTLELGNKYGASLGAGLRIENHKFDISYNYSQQNNTYDFFDGFNQIDPVDLTLKRNDVSFTYSYIF
ncbi:OmpP1/FadL family transporter [Wenyingzhuangia sp. IMCC45533]